MKTSAPFLLLLLSLFAFSAACTDPAAKLQTYEQVPHFSMVDSYGRSFDNNVLTGKVWVADFIYTHCPGPCPRMTSQMHKVEQRIHDDAGARIVSFSVDPTRDTPPVLNDFARRFGGPTAHWYFLTGEPSTIHLLARKVFMVGDLIGAMDHSTKFILVDKKSRIRGYYSTFDPQSIHDLLRDLHALERSRA